MTYQDIQGWFSWEALYKRMVDNAPDSGAVFVEVGVFLGKSAVFMAQQIKESRKPIYFWCVDPWNRDVSGMSVQESGGSFFQQFRDNINKCGVGEQVRPLALTSTMAARLVGMVDFVFIDAEHDYDCVRWDIADWLPKIRSGGTIAGHDYTLNPDTKRAVNDVFGPKVEVEGECWLVKL